MARRARPFTVRPRNGIAWFDATIAGTRHRESLGVPYPERPTADELRRVQEAARAAFARLVGGRTLGAHARIATDARLDELVGDWLDAITTATNARSVATLRVYGGHWCEWAESLADARTPLERLVADDGPRAYALHRLSRVLRKTVRKELTALRAWLEWCEARGYLASLPPRPALPRGETGVRSGPQRARPVRITPDEARAILAALPEWSSDGARGEPFRVRAFFAFAWETGLRPSTIERLEVPANWSRGARELVLRDADDKARFGRELPLSAEAVAILEAVALKAGAIFGRHDRRRWIKAAGRAVLSGERAKRFAAYDLRHGRIADMLAASSDLAATAYLAGHRQLTTTNAYLEGSLRGARRLVAALDSGAIPSQREREKTAVLPTRSKIPTGYPVGASGFEPPTPRPPGQRESGNAEENAHALRQTTTENAERPHFDDGIRARFRHTDSPGLVRAEWDAWDAWDAWAWEVER